MKADETINIYHFEPNVTVLGPGSRSILWLQGCSFNCLGCIVPDSHDRNKGIIFSISDIASQISSNQSIEGVTISGGEPFLQNKSLYKLLLQLKKESKNLSIIVFTGYTLEQLITNTINKQILSLCDVLIDGLFMKEKFIQAAWRGSENQRIHFLSKRYSWEDYHKVKPNQLEFFFNEKNEYFIAGIPPDPDFVNKFDEKLRAKGLF